MQRLGLPADPGNLLMMAAIGDMPVIGMPGCARSARLNGFDWVLQLLLAGIEIDQDEIADMAIGGLLMEIASRPLPRKMVERRRPTNIVIGGILLAAGSSRRMGETNKLLVEIDGQPMVRHAAMAMLEGGIRDLVVVTGHQQDLVRRALQGLEVTFIHNADFAAGQAGSVAVGVGAVPAGVSGCAHRAWRHAVCKGRSGGRDDPGSCGTWRWRKPYFISGSSGKARQPGSVGPWVLRCAR